MTMNVFLSPDPQPHRRFSVRLSIEGKDATGQPHAVIGDEYSIVPPPGGIIIFDVHTLCIESVDAKNNHRAEIEFVSRDGFSTHGTFGFTCKKRTDPTVSKEFPVTVLAPVAAATEPKNPAPPTSTVALPSLKMVPVAVPASILSAHAASPAKTTPAVVTKSTAPNPAAKTTTAPAPGSKLGNTIIWIVGIGAACALAFGIMHASKKNNTVVSTLSTHQTLQTKAINEADAENAHNTEKPDAGTGEEDVAKDTSADVKTSAKPNVPPPPEKQPDPTPPQQKTRKPRCGVCP